MRLWGQSASPNNRVTIGRDTIIALTKAAAMSNTFKLKAFYLEQESFRKSEIIDSLKIKYSLLSKELSEQRLDTNKYRTQRNRDRTAIAVIVAFLSGYLLLSSKFAWLGRIIVWIRKILGK